MFAHLHTWARSLRGSLDSRSSWERALHSISSTTTTTPRRFFAPEVIQTSEMDCGPAALKCLLEGFGISAGYGRLREACQTDVDGTSIDTIEDVAWRLGLDAGQTVAPIDHLLLPEADLLPALVVTVQPNGLTHFVVLWNCVGPFVQIMDPSVGRRWITRERFADEIYHHSVSLPAVAWREWAGTKGFGDPLRVRMGNLALAELEIEQFFEEASTDPSWRSLATLDAATRLIEVVAQTGALQRGPEATAMLRRFFQQGRQNGHPAASLNGDELIPPSFWSVHSQPQPPSEQTGTDQRADPGEEEMLLLQGAVFLTVAGRQTDVIQQGTKSESPIPEPLEDAQPSQAQPSQAQPSQAQPTQDPTVDLPPDLLAAISETPVRPDLEIWQALRADGLLTPLVLLVALFFAALGVTLEALVLRGLVDLGNELDWVGQHLALLVLVISFTVLLLLLEMPIEANSLRLGRRLESRLRMAFLAKIPRLNDRYFASRLVSDMTQRAHDLRQLRMLPEYGTRFLRVGFQLLLTMIGVIWIAAGSPLLAILALLTTFGFAVLTQPLLVERDMRMRAHAGGLSRYYLDTLLGLIPLRTHSAAQAMRREHESLLVEWARAARSFYTSQALVQGVALTLNTGFAVLIVLRYIAQGGEASGVLLLLYWTLNLPQLGQEMAIQAQQYPTLRNSVLRILEPLGAPEEHHAVENENEQKPAAQAPKQPQIGVAIQLTDVAVIAGGHRILRNINLSIAPGEHVAILGASGAGKSSLIGLLLGWHKATHGQVTVNGHILDTAQLEALRRVTAWVDPSVQIWNRSLMENLLYGNDEETEPRLGQILTEADLYEVMERLPRGLQTILGENGGLVSGGEGQRVRLGRAFLRPHVQLAILDEPFRGLDRTQRRQLLHNVRQIWQQATLLCITHDVSVTQEFDRVLIVDQGQIVEDGSPTDLQTHAASRYQELLRTERNVHQGIWQTVSWQQMWLDNGTVQVLRNANLQPQEPASQRDDFEQIRGIGPIIAERLYAAGIETFAALAQLTPARLEEIAMPTRKIPGVNPQAWIDQARALAFSQKG
ncbi:MAG: ATP-binding cassette domain-containing protein [Caldilineaceae bacterium]|nr:ATP-binding cassette domain-containing protein [Caldilineaceae bacterium]